MHRAAEGFSHVILDGKIIPADRCREKVISVKGEVIDLWYSGKAHAHGPARLATSPALLLSSPISSTATSHKFAEITSSAGLTTVRAGTDLPKSGS
jgi:hypothetical protein